MGSSINDLLAFDTMGIHLPFITYEQFTEPKVMIDLVTLRFIVNGQSLDTLNFEPHVEVPVRFVNNNRSIAWASYKWTARIPAPREK